MGMKERRKGKTGELELVQFLKDRGYHARRGQQFKGTKDSPDVIVPEWPHFHVECKRVEKLNLDKAMAKALAEASASQAPLVFHRKNGKPWLVTLPADDFLELL